MNNYTKEQVKAIIGLHSQACRDCEEQVRIAHSMGDHEQGRFWIGIWEDHLKHWEQIVRDAYGPEKPARKLSPRRQQVYDILANGNWSAPATIAGRLNISRQYVHVLMTDIRCLGIEIESRRVANARSGKGYQKIFRIVKDKAA